MRKLLAAISASLLLCSISHANQDHSAHKGGSHSHQGHGSQADAHFLDRFVKHHQDGIEMAKLAQEKARSPGIKQMASKILKDQPKEIAQMQTWRSRHFSAVDRASDMPPKMDMSKLQGVDGKEFDVAFADMMAKHHEDGIKMIESVERELKNPEVKQFVAKSKKNQSHEQTQLAQLRASIQGSSSGTTSGQ